MKKAKIKGLLDVGVPPGNYTVQSAKVTYEPGIIYVTVEASRFTEEGEKPRKKPSLKAKDLATVMSDSVHDTPFAEFCKKSPVTAKIEMKRAKAAIKYLKQIGVIQ